MVAVPSGQISKLLTAVRACPYTGDGGWRPSEEAITPFIGGGNALSSLCEGRRMKMQSRRTHTADEVFANKSKLTTTL